MSYQKPEKRENRNIDPNWRVIPVYSPSGERTDISVAELDKQIKLWLFDADGTLRRCTVEGQPCPNKPGEWELIPEAMIFLSLIDWTRHAAPECGVVSNQGRVEAGHLTESAAHDLLVDMCDEILSAMDYRWRYFIFIMMCESNNKEHPHRKPNPGMLLEAMRSSMVDAADTIMIGDMPSDREAAKNAGVLFAWAQEAF